MSHRRFLQVSASNLDFQNHDPWLPYKHSGGRASARGRSVRKHWGKGVGSGPRQGCHGALGIKSHTTDGRQIPRELLSQVNKRGLQDSKFLEGWLSFTEIQKGSGASAVLSFCISCKESVGRHVPQRGPWGAGLGSRDTRWGHLHTDGL